MLCWWELSYIRLTFAFRIMFNKTLKSSRRPTGKGIGRPSASVVLFGAEINAAILRDLGRTKEGRG